MSEAGYAAKWGCLPCGAPAAPWGCAPRLRWLCCTRPRSPASPSAPTGSVLGSCRPDALWQVLCQWGPVNWQAQESCLAAFKGVNHNKTGWERVMSASIQRAQAAGSQNNCSGWYQTNGRSLAAYYRHCSSSENRPGGAEGCGGTFASLGGWPCLNLVSLPVQNSLAGALPRGDACARALALGPGRGFSPCAVCWLLWSCKWA